MALTRPRYSQIPDTDYKQSVRVATTADVGNVMLAAMPNTVDGITLNFYDRVLVRSQANAAQNGIYYVKAVGTGSNGIWERTKDANQGGALGGVTPSIVTMVEEGTTNKNRTFKLTTTGNIDLGTTDLSFGVQAAEPAGSTGQLQFANVNNVIGGATTTSYDYTTGNLTLTGNVNTTLLYQNGKRVAQVFTSATPPVDPAVGDQWYQVGTDILYEWLQDGATAYWIDVSGATIANVNPITGENIGTLVVNSGDESTSTTTGALQVVGGVGITGNLNVGGAVSFGGGQLGSDLVISSNTTSISETTGAIRIASPGGLGVGGNIWAGGAIVANSRIPSTSISTGAIILPGVGGIGLGGNIWAGGDITAIGNITGGGVRQSISSGAPSNPVVGDQWYQLGTDILYQYVSDGTNSYWVDVAGATVANISQQTNTVNDIHLVSGTPSIDPTTGALIVSGGVGITGNLNLQGGFNVIGGNIVANQNVTSTDTTTGAIVITGQGGLGVGGNINAGGNLIVGQSANFGQNVTIAANLVAGGTYFTAGGLSVTNGNVIATGTTAQIGGLTITAGAISGISSLGITGNTTIGGLLTVTGDISTSGNITGGGLRKYAQVNKPDNPVVGDVWYKTDTDVYYTYVNDGTNTYWIDYAGATVANITPQTNQTLSDIVIVSGTPSTNTTSGALQVQGGAGITGNVYAGNIAIATVTADNFTYANGVSILEGNQGTYSNANVTAYLAASDVSVGGNLTAGSSYFSAGGLSVTAGNIVASGALAVIGGLTIENGGISSLASLNVIGSGTIGGDFAVTGNITGGGLRKYAQVGAPANPVVGDVWYKTDTDVFYQYVNDGTNKYWIDYTSATVSNASPTSPQSLQDLQIVSGTPSTGTSSGALVVQGGAGISGNVFTGNLSTGTVAASEFTYANGVSIFDGYYQGTYSNANVTAYLTQRTTTISDGFLSTAGMTVTAGNLKTSSANIGGVVIEAGSIGSLASLNVIGGATIGGDVTITGNITGGGIRKTTSISAPANPVVGDQWYKTDTDTLYQYINDGTTNYWVDVAGATVSNARTTGDQIAYDIVITTDTPSTSATTGALRVQGGIGLIGNIYTTEIADFGGNLTANNIKANNNLQTATLAVTQNATVGGTLTVDGAVTTGNLTTGNIVGYGFTTNNGNLTTTGQYFSAAGLSVTNGNMVTTGTTATIAGLVIENGGFADLASLGVIGAATFGANVDVTGNLNVTGNVMGGGLRKYAQISKPTNAVPGDVWYKTDTDVYYTYVNDGTNSYWIDYVGPTVSNAAVDNSTNNDFTIASGTESTDPNTGALVVVGGVGITGDINATGDFTIDGTFTACTAVTAGYLNVADGIDSYGNVIIHGPGTENYTVQVRSSDAADDVLGIKTSATGGGFAIDALNSELTGATPLGINANTFSIGIKNAIGATVQADAFKVDTTGNASVAKTLSVGQHVNVTGNVNAGVGTFTSLFASTANLTTLNLSGALTVSTLNVTTSIDAPGIRKYAQVAAPTSPAVGDVWYKTDTDVYYTYVNDGTTNYWIDYVGATVSNAAVDNSVNQDFRIASGTESTDTDTGALTVVGGVGVVGNIFAGGIVSAQGQLRAISGVQSTNTTTGALVVTGGLGVSANINVGGALAADSLTIAGPTNLSGNLSGTNMSLTGRADIAGAMAIAGATTIGGNLDVTGRVVGGGIRKTTSISAPDNPVVGDIWYKTDTDVLYQYINDGTTNFWVDYVGPSVSNASPSTGLLSDLEVVTGTSSTSTVTGAARITGGVGITENLYVGGLATVGANLLANNITANLNIQSTTAAVIGNLYAGNISTGIATIARADIAGALTVGGDVTVTGNIDAGGVRKTQSTTPPANPAVGDLWYKTDTDVYYQYTSDGVNKYWIDYVGATVSNAAVQTGSDNDFTITSGTPSTDTSTGALTIIGGAGITGNINAGNVIATGFYADTFVFSNGQPLSSRITGTFSNTNVAAYLTGAITTGNIAAGNIATLDITARDVTLTGNITGGGLRKYAQVGAPTNPVLGDVWYKTDTDVYYTYINDGTTNIWVDYVGPTISNATIDNSTNIDFTVASGTESTGYSSGALRVVGGVGVVGNIYASNNIVVGDNLTVNGATLLQSLQVATTATVGQTLDVTGNITGGDRIEAGGIIAEYGNLTASGAYLSAGGISATSGVLSVGNIISSGSKAVVGGLTIENGAFGNIASLGVIGSALIGGDLEVTGNITGGGLRKYAQISAPANPIVGDVWYKTDTDVYYTYINDGTTNYWVDYVGPTVSNAVVDSQQLNYDLVITTNTPSTDSSTGAIRVSGGVGIIGNLNLTGDTNLNGSAVIAGTLDAGAATLASVSTGALSATNIDATNIVATGAIATVGNLTGGSTYFRAGGITGSAGNLTASGTYFSAGGLSVTAGNINTANFSVTNGNIVATGQRAELGGLVIENGGFADLASLSVIGAVDVGGDVEITGNIMGGGLRKTQSTTPPVNPVQGDIWYKTDSDIYYQYISDGTSSFWVDYTSAAVANVTVSAETVGDLHVASGTPSTDPTNGALRVAGGIGVVGDVNISSNVTVGNVVAGKVYTPQVFADVFTYANGASILDGYYFGTYSNANVTGYLTAQGISTTGGNLTASGTYFSAAGLTALAGNLIATGARAEIGGLVIENGAFADIASLGVIGSATIGGDLAITGNITAGGLRKYAQTNAPATPIVGDVWYKTDADIYYTYVNDGTSTYWIDYTSAAIANITVANSQYGSDVGFVSGTLSTDQTTGAVVVIGGVGITGNINLTGRVTALETITGQSIVSNTSIAGVSLSLSESAAIGGNLLVDNVTATGNLALTGRLTVGSLAQVPGNLSATGSYFSAGGLTALNGNLTSTGTTATIGGLTIDNGSFGSVASIDVIGSATIGSDITVTGNIVAGGVRKTTSISAPANPVVGDQWYKTDTDILYQYVNDGTSTYWVDFMSATVANITNDFDGLGDFQTVGNVIGNGIVSDNYYYANGVSFVTTTVANTQNIVANITNGFNLGLNLTPTGVVAGNYGSATSIPTIVTDEFGRITSVTSNAVSTTFGLIGNVGTSSVNGGDTLVIVGTPNQITTTVSGNVIEIGFTPNITFNDFTVSGNLTYQGGGIKTTTSPTPPASPVNGDMWYQSGTDILYRYVYDGTNEYWLDLFSTPLRAVLPSRDIGGDNGEVQFNDNGTFGANVNFAFDKTTGTLQVERFRVTNPTVPTSPSSPGLKGEIAYDNEFMYVCISTNSWVRAALYTW